MTVRIDVIAFVLFGFALFIHPEIPIWYAFAEQFLGWFWFCFTSLVVCFGVLLLMNNPLMIKLALHLNVDPNTAPKFKLSSYIWSWSVVGIALYSAHVQGFFYLFGFLLGVTIIFQILRAVQYAKKA